MPVWSQKRLLGVAALVLAGTLALGACGAPTKKSTDTKNEIAKDATVKVMWNQPMYSYNASSASGNATANANIVYLTSSSFWQYNQDLQEVDDKSFGSYELVSESPQTVKLTLADTATWSDGTPVTAADLILAFGAQSTQFNTVSGKDAEKLKDNDGKLKPNKEGSIYFDAVNTPWKLIKEFPTVSEDGKSLTYTYSETYADWKTNLITPLLPAHIVGKRALGESDPTKAAQKVLDAFKNKDKAALSKISNVWNQDWNFVELPKDPDLLVVNGPYKIVEYKKSQYLTLKLNENYKGDHKPKVSTITIRYNEDPSAAVQALANGEVDIISPQSTADILTQLKDLQGVNVETGTEAVYEHVDLTFNNKGPFDPATYGGDKEKAKKVRQAFLLTVPRQEIIDKLIKPLNDKAEIRNSFNVVQNAPHYQDTINANGMKDVYAKVDIEKAKSLLAEAGAKKPTVRMMFAQKNQRRIGEFQLIKASAEKAGFKVVDASSADWGRKLGDKTYDAVFFGWQSTSTAITEPDANYRTDGPNNFGGYLNPEIDKLYDELRGTTDTERQKQINIEVEKMLVNDAFGVTLFEFPGVVASSAKIKNVSAISLSPTIFWNFWDWEVTA